jgi:isopentenyldiphosphate isomerase
MAELWAILDENGNATGRLHERGKPMGNGEYHLSVTVWIENDKGEYLISKRSPNKPFPNLWECTGGNAVAGDDSLTTALKETKEELGIILKPQNGRMIQHQIRKCICNHCLADVWLFRQNVDIITVTLAPDETCGAMWASRDGINRMIDEGTFTTWGLFTDMNELFGEE